MAKRKTPVLVVSGKGNVVQTGSNNKGSKTEYDKVEDINLHMRKYMDGNSEKMKVIRSLTEIISTQLSEKAWLAKKIDELSNSVEELHLKKCSSCTKAQEKFMLTRKSPK